MEMILLLYLRALRVLRGENSPFSGLLKTRGCAIPQFTMKHLAALVILFFAVSAFAGDAPPVSARQALDAAEKSMSERGLDKDIYVASVSMTHSSMFGGESFWLVKYSHPIPADESNQQEIGIKVAMNGAVSRYVKILGRP